MIQKALVVTTSPDGARTATLDALDDLLRAGWRVLLASPMGGGGATDGFASLVVLERRSETEAETLLEQIEEEAEGDGAPDELLAPVLRQILGDDD